MAENKWEIDGHHYTCPDCKKTIAIVVNESDEDFEFCPFCGKRVAENKMKSYEGLKTMADYGCGTTKIKVYFQNTIYKGAMIYEIDSPYIGLQIFPRNGMRIIKESKSATFDKMSLKPYDDDSGRFAEVVLTAENGETCLYEVKKEYELEYMIVGIQIIDFKGMEWAKQAFSYN